MPSYNSGFLRNPASSTIASSNPNIDDLTVMSIATGGYNAEEMIKTLHSPGGWKSDGLMVLMDDCYPHPDPSLAQTITVPRTHSSLEAKLYKSKLFEYAKTQRVVFMDSDVFMHRSLTEYLKKIEPWDDSCDLYMQVYPFFPFVSYGNMLSSLVQHIVMALDSGFDVWNSGLVLMDRDRSARFLKEWNKLIASGNYKKDQWAIRHLLETDKTFKLCPLPEEMFLEASFVGRINKYFYDYTFIHETSANSARYDAICHPGA